MRLAPISSRETRGAKVEACASRKAAIARTREPQTTADQRPQRGGACGLRRQRGPNQALKGQGFTGSVDALRLSAGDQIERKRDTRRKRQNDAPIDRTLRNDHRSHEPQAKAQRLARGHALPQQHGKDAARRANEIGACRRRQRDPRQGKKITGHRPTQEQRRIVNAQIFAKPSTRGNRKHRWRQQRHAARVRQARGEAVTVMAWLAVSQLEPNPKLGSVLDSASAMRHESVLPRTRGVCGVEVCRVGRNHLD
jgi:hypothetical protein